MWKQNRNASSRKVLESEVETLLRCHSGLVCIIPLVHQTPPDICSRHHQTCSWHHQTPSNTTVHATDTTGHHHTCIRHHQTCSRHHQTCSWDHQTPPDTNRHAPGEKYMETFKDKHSHTTPIIIIFGISGSAYFHFYWNQRNCWTICKSFGCNEAGEKSKRFEKVGGIFLSH